MEPVKVPQHLELEDVLAWGLGAADLLYLVVGGLVAWWVYLALPAPFALRGAAGAALAAAASALAIGSLGDQPVRAWIAILARYITRPRLRLYGGPS